MLADDIRASAGNQLDRAIHGGLSVLGQEIAKAKRFDLSPGVVRTAMTISASRLSSQIRALPLCRFPFRKVWWEWPGSDPQYEPHRKDTVDGVRQAPQRMGVLIETDETGQTGTMTFAWSHRLHGVSPCPISCAFDFREDFSEVQDVARTIARTLDSEEALRDTLFFQRQGVEYSKDEHQDDVLKDAFRFGYFPSPHFEAFWESLKDAHGRIPGPGSPEWQQWGGDIEGEPGVVRSLIMLLNSKNLTQQLYVEAPKPLNKQREKKGKVPILDHTVIGIKLSPALKRRVGAGDQNDRARLHAVRGHFKIRKSGIYFWSDHHRGDITKGVVSGSYRVDLERVEEVSESLVSAP